jgi:hypothetical protein
MAGALPSDAIEPIATLFAETLFESMTAMVMADTVEAGFGKIQQAAKKLTKAGMHRIADVAGRYCAEHYPSSGNLSKDRWTALKKRALEFALKTNGK